MFFGLLSFVHGFCFSRRTLDLGPSELQSWISPCLPLKPAGRVISTCLKPLEVELRDSSAPARNATD